MASISNAGAIFGKYCKENKIFFEVPMLGRVYIGITLIDLLRDIYDTAQVGFELTQNGRVYTFKVNDDISLACVVNGKCISEIRYKNIQNFIDMSKLYTYNGKTYITNASCEGYMMRVINYDKVKLESSEGVPNILINYEIKNQRSIRRSETDNLIMWYDRCRRKGEALPKSTKSVEVLEESYDEYKDLKAKREELVKEYKVLRYAVEDKKNYVDMLKERLKEVKKPHDAAIGELVCTFSEALNHTTLNALVGAGKLRRNEDGTFSLMEGSRTPDVKNTYWDHYLENTSSVDVNMYLKHSIAAAHGMKPKHDANEDYIFSDNSTHYGNDFTVARAYLRTDVQKDEMYLAAAKWLRFSETQYFTKKVRDAYVKVKEVKNALAAAEEELRQLQASPEYIATCVKFTEVGNQIDAIDAKLKKIKEEVGN